MRNNDAAKIREQNKAAKKALKEKEREEASAAMNLKVALGLKHGTNIDSVVIPPELDRTVKTGIDFLDDAFGGEGMTPSSSVLFTGTPGAGKTTLMLQLASMITKQGHVALYNTNEEAATQVKKVCRRLQLGGFYVGDDRFVEKVLEHAEFIKKMPENKGKQVFIIGDSLQTLNDGKYREGTNSMTQVRVTEMFTEWCKRTFGISILIGQVTKSGEFAGKQQVKHTVDIHAHLFIDEEKKSETYGERIFEVQKNRFGCNGKTYILDMDGEKGLGIKQTFGGFE